MHEFSLCKNLLVRLEAEAARREIRHIHRVVLRVSALSCIDPEALRFCFSAIARTPLTRGAELVINRVPAKACCHDCAAEYWVEEWTQACPACGGHNRYLDLPDEIVLQEINIR